MLEWYTSRADTDDGLRAMLAQLAQGGGGNGGGGLPPLPPQQPPQQAPSRRAERQRLRALLAAARRLDEGVAAGGLLGQLELAMRLARLYSPSQLEAMLGAAARARENIERASRLVEVLDGVEARGALKVERQKQQQQQQEQQERGRSGAAAEDAASGGGDGGSSAPQGD